MLPSKLFPLRGSIEQGGRVVDGLLEAEKDRRRLAWKLDAFRKWCLPSVLVVRAEVPRKPGFSRCRSSWEKS